MLLDDAFLEQLAEVCPDVSLNAADRAEASRDWWPLAMIWATQGQVGQVAGAVARPTSTSEVAAVMRLCHQTRIPVTPAAGRSSVVGGPVPVHGGVLLDLTALSGIVAVDSESGVVEVMAGTFGDAMEAELADRHGLTVGHWPHRCHCRRWADGWRVEAQDSFPTATARSKTSWWDSRWCWPMGAPSPHRGPTPRSGRPRPHPPLRGGRGHLGVVTPAWLQAWPTPTGQGRWAWDSQEVMSSMAPLNVDWRLASLYQNELGFTASATPPSRRTRGPPNGGGF